MYYIVNSSNTVDLFMYANNTSCELNYKKLLTNFPAMNIDKTDNWILYHTITKFTLWWENSSDQ